MILCFTLLLKVKANLKPTKDFKEFLAMIWYTDRVI